MCFGAISKDLQLRKSTTSIKFHKGPNPELSPGFLSKFLLSANYVPRIHLVAGYAIVNLTDENHCLQGAHIPMGEVHNKKISKYTDVS